MKATFENSFCLDNRCIHHFEDMCMGALSDNGSETEIEPMTSRPRTKDCPEFRAGTFLIYEVDLKEEDFSMEIKIKYFSKDYPRLEKISQGDWIDLRVDNIKEWESGRFILTGKDKEKLASLPMLESVVKYEKGDIIKFGLGVAMELPKGYEAEMRPRSSTFKHWGLIQTNSVGTIDNSYKGDNDEWQIEFIAMRDGSINRFDRVCQFRIWEKQPEFSFVEVDKLGNDDRGGFGSTGGNPMTNLIDQIIELYFLGGNLQEILKAAKDQL